MFYLKYFLKNAWLTLLLLARGEWGRVGLALYARIYPRVYFVLFALLRPLLKAKGQRPGSGDLSVQTSHPVAFASPDHVVPHGTKYNNSTNRKFVLLMNAYFRRRFASDPLAFMDLGCSGGQLVADFASIGWVAVGLEGSDYSLKHRRANWKTLAGKNLFTCDITKPFRVRQAQDHLKFHLITAWEVMEHIHLNDLGVLFDNIRSHLRPGGCFIASTSSSTSIVDGVELHQTRLKNAEWRAYIAERYSDLEPVDLGLRVYQYVRFDLGEQSFLLYRKGLE